MPRSSAAVSRPELGTVAWEYMIEAALTRYIGLQILPIKRVVRQSAEYPVIPMEVFMETPKTERADRGNYNRSDWKFDFQNYSTEEHGWEEVIDDREEALFQTYFDMEEAATIRAMAIILRSHEKRVKDLVYDTGTIANGAVGNAWTDPANATPKADVDGARDSMRSTFGVLPGKMTIAYTRFNALLRTAEIRDALKYTNPIELGGFEAQKRIMAQYFGLDEILVGDAQENTAKKGQTGVLGEIWTPATVGLFATSSGGDDMKEPVIGRTMLWEEGAPDMLTTETYRDEPVRGDVVRIRNDTDEILQFIGAGYLLTSI
jgi:hypothetical protein